MCQTALTVVSGVQQTLDTTGAADGPSPSCGGGGLHRAAWFAYTTDGTGQQLKIDTYGSSYDTILAVYTGRCGTLTAVSGGCNDNANGTAQSQVVLASTTLNTTYYIVVTSYGTGGGNLKLNLAYGTPPHSNAEQDGYPNLDTHTDSHTDPHAHGFATAAADLSHAQPHGNGHANAPWLITVCVARCAVDTA